MLASIYAVSNGMNIHKLDGCHAPLNQQFFKFTIDLCTLI